MKRLGERGGVARWVKPAGCVGGVATGDGVDRREVTEVADVGLGDRGAGLLGSVRVCWGLQ